MMRANWKKMGAISILFALVVLFGPLGFSQQEKGTMHHGGKAGTMLGMRDTMAEMDTMMAACQQTMKQMMGKGMMTDSTSMMHMHNMMMSMQNMMQCMKDFMGNMDSTMRNRTMMKDQTMNKHMQEMKELMEHIIEHLPEVMENMEGMTKGMKGTKPK